MRSRRPEAERYRRRWLASRGPRPAAASLILIGLVIGTLAALYYAWILSPVVYTQASPARLNDSYKAEYILLVGQSYAADQDWDLALVRLNALNEPDLNQRLKNQLESSLREGQPAAVLRDLAALAARLGVESPAVALFAPGSVESPATAGEFVAGPPPAAEATRPPTATPFPTLTPTVRPTPTEVPVFRLLDREQLCLAGGPAPRIEVIAVDSLLEPLAGAEIIVQWDGGSEHFFTGYQPEKGLGFADFDMTPEVSYTVFMAEGSRRVDNLAIVLCPVEAGGHAGGWQLTFQNSDVRQETPTPTPAARG